MTEQTYRERRPAPAVRTHVASVWVQRVAAGSDAHAHRTIPHGAVELSCPVGGLPFIVGPQTVPRIDTLAPGTTVVGVRFQLGAASSVLGVPASELVDRSLDGDELWGAEAARIGERIAAAEDPAAELEQEVLARSGKHDGPDPVVAEAARRLRAGRGQDVGSLPSELFVSERTLRRRVEAGIGLAPKVLHRMLRFQAFLALAHGRGGDPAELAMLAAEAGYADQSHLTRECLRLAGLSPRALMQESLENCRKAGHDHAVSYEPLLAAIS